MYKTNDEIIKIQAKATTPIPTGVVFWSHDKGTAKLRFELLKGPVAQNIAEGSKVPIRLEFLSKSAEGGKGKHDYLATIEDRVNGIVSIVLADNIMGYVGTVTGSIYIDFPNSTSIDTAGRFTFEIRRSPIDENTPEIEDYYFNGWSEIQKKLDEKIALTDLEIEKLKIKLDNLDKKTDGIKATQETILKSIADNELVTKEDLEQAKYESSANVIDQVIGKVSNENKVIIDLKGKIVGSAVENPNDAKVTHTQTLLNPNSTDFFTLSQQAYDQQKDLDGVVLTVSNSLNGRFRQNVYSWDILTVTKKIVGDAFFEGLNADTVAKQVAILKKMVNVKTAVWGFGSNYSGNKLSLKIWGNDTSWIGEANHTEATISKLEYDSTLNTNSFISEDGFVYVTAFSEPSDGNTASSLSVDYANLELEFNLSVHEYINNMIAAYSGENSVSLSEPQTVEGLKNFSDGVQSKGIDVATQDMTKVTLFQSTEISNVKGTASGIVWPIDETAIVFGGVGAHARRGGTSEPGTIYFNEAGQYLIELLWFVNSGTATRKYVYMDWIKHGTTDLLFRSGIGENNGFSYTSSVPGGGIITMGKDEGVDILLKTNVEDLIAGVKIYYIKISKIG
ncbi:BppU family phage baseplate upper protein [Enterococcus avium]|uniref:BppU family phage baseplate upper protein n=1 Tax=Enterococcus avium TaxID=33945 RepID=UPI00288EC098|nr:BppU family phage baseplate upper protein [Enterococcus avium]MDT2428440.1 BppU family phage baseplate upper protein [Enterococcus avium]